MRRSFELCPDGATALWALCLFLLVLAGPAAGVEIPFSSAASLHGAFDGASSVELADLDGDGDLDAVATAATFGRLVWWENTAGDGSAWTEHNIEISFGDAASVQVADLDRDGNPDLLAAAQTGDEIAWHRNDGTPADGGWTRFSIDTAFAGARSVRVADLDGNGTPDVLAAGDVADEVAWWENDGDPTDDTTDLGGGDYWVQHTILGGMGDPSSVFAADLDGDGFLDVVAAAPANDSVGWFQNDGDPTDGGWTARFVDNAFPDASSVWVADVDGDGDPDVLAAADQAGDAVAWWRNDGDPSDNVDDGSGNFWPQHTVANAFDGASGVRAFDLDGDGDLDVLAAGDTEDTLAWWENDGDPTDDTADLGGGNFWTVHTVDASFDGAEAVAAGDVDGDGDPDLVGAASDGGLVSWWQNETIHRSALYDAEGQVATATAPEGLALADVDGDGDLDVVSGSQESTAELSWWENDGTPGDGGWTEHLVGNPLVAPLAVAAGDLDGDGDLDLVTGAGIFGADLSWWENDGTPATGSWTEHVLKAAASRVPGIELADLDGDGDLDVVFAESFADTVGWFENDGSACSPACAWPERTVDGTFTNPNHLAVADLDADGDLDVASQSNLDELLVWWENDGSPAGDSAWTEHGIDSGSSILCPVVAADLDADGDLDVLSCPGSESSLRWFENDGAPAGDPSWTARTQIVLPPAHPTSVLVADLDADGDLDVAGAVPDQGTADELFAAWWENTAGDGSAWTRHTFATPLDLFRMALGDLDRDGKPDLAGTRIQDDTVAWWANGGGQLALATDDRSSGGLLDGTSDDLLAITATHRGRTGDSPAELVTFELLFEEAAGDPLSTAEANALLDSVEIYLDDGSGVLDGADALVTTVSPLALTAGVQTVALPAGADTQVELATPKTYLVVATAATDASAQTPSTFRMTHRTESSSTARDATGLVPLELEHAADVATGDIAVQGGCFALTLSHFGGGADPVATPTQSLGCGAGEFVPGEVVALTAAPDAGWQVTGWSGTDGDSSTEAANSVTMPGAAHAVSVTYAFPDELILDGDFLGGTQEKEACLTIRAGDVPDVDPAGAQTSIAAGAQVTFRAGQSVVFHDGFRVLENASFVVEIADPSPCLP